MHGLLGVRPPQPKGLARWRQMRLPLEQRRQLPMPQPQRLQTLVPVEEQQGRLLAIGWECKRKRRVAKGGRVVATRTRKPKWLLGEVESGREMCLRLV